MCRSALSGRLHNSRGAAFLLAVYFAALMLFVLGGVSLQRTTVDVRAAELSRSLSQSFWAAEGTLDKMLYDLGEGSLEGNFDESGLCATGDIADDQLSAVANLTRAGYYSLCLASEPDDQPRIYSADITGQMGNAQQHLSAVIAVRDASVTFKDVLHGQEGVTTYRVLTGAVDTGKTAGVATQTDPPQWTYDAITKRPKVTTGITANGNISTNSTTPGAVQILESSYVAGNINVGQGVEPSTVVNVESSGEGKSTVLGTVGTIDGDLLDLPPIEAPKNARDLGELVLSGASSSRVLTPGTYTASRLQVTNKAVLTTAGPVNLYVTGPITIWDSQVYGEPVHATGQTCHPEQEVCLSPKNLRIFAKPDSGGQGITINQNAVVGAAIYAPEMTASLYQYPLIIGALTVKSVQAGQIDYEGVEGAAATLLYDTDLGRQSVPVVQGEKMANLRMVRLDEIALGATPADEDEDLSSEAISPPTLRAHRQYYGGGGSGCGVCSSLGCF
jgi:hypothetical protein